MKFPTIQALALAITHYMGTTEAIPSPVMPSGNRTKIFDLIDKSALIDNEFAQAYFGIDLADSKQNNNNNTFKINAALDDIDYEAPIPDYRDEIYPKDKKVPYWLLPECHRTCWDKTFDKCDWVKDVRELSANDFCDTYQWTLGFWMLGPLMDCVIPGCKFCRPGCITASTKWVMYVCQMGYWP